MSAVTPERLGELLKAYTDAKVAFAAESERAKQVSAEEKTPVRDVLFEHLTTNEQETVRSFIASVVSQASDPASMKALVDSWRGGVSELFDRLHEDATVPHPDGSEIPRRCVKLVPCEMVMIQEAKS